MGTNTENSGWEDLNQLYEASMSTMGTPLEFRIFDTQNCEHLQIEWLASAVEQSGVTRAELDCMLNEGLLRLWTGPTGKQGFILYSERQAVLAKALRDSGRYTTAELRHIFDDWNSFLEIVMVEDLTYDSFEVDDYDHFRRRAAEMVAFFTDDTASPMFHGTAAQQAAQKEEAAERLRLWKWISDMVNSRPDAELTPNVQAAWRKQLFQLRWTDEWSRMITAQQIATQIEQGYSSEVTFNGSEWSNGEMKLTNLNWPSTLQRLKDTRNEGKVFPLRTPDFNVTEAGIAFLTPPMPETYQVLFEKYRLDLLTTLLKEWGASLWQCDLAASGRAECADCGAPFERTKASRRFCSDRCRNRAKARAWREKNPEQARQSQAKYYRETYPEVQGE
jgi:hypothetical protein